MKRDLALHCPHFKALGVESRILVVGRSQALAVLEPTCAAKRRNIEAFTIRCEQRVDLASVIAEHVRAEEAAEHVVHVVGHHKTVGTERNGASHGFNAPPLAKLSLCGHHVDMSTCRRPSAWSCLNAPGGALRASAQRQRRPSS